MHLNNILLIIFLIGVQILSAQKKEIAVYYEGEGYLQPFITSTIDSLKSNQTNDYKFTTISLNQLKLQNKIESEKGKLLQIYFSPKNNNFNLTDSEKEAMKEINSQINDSDYLLVVKTITLVELIEFQFQLFVPKDKKNSNINITNIDLESTEDLFINPKEQSYKKNLTDAIQRLFKDTNFAPLVELSYLEKRVKSNDTICIPLNTPIELDGSNSGDFESEEIKYIWRNIIPKNKKIQTTNKISFEQNQDTQTIVLSKNGKYKIGFSTYDNINYSREIIVNIKTIPKLDVIKVEDSLIITNYHKTLFKKDIYRFSEWNEIRILNDSIINNKIVVSKKPFTTNNTLRKKIKEVAVNNEKINLLSDFTESNITEFYLYQKDSLNFLSEPKKITNIAKGFSILSISARASVNLIYTDEQNDSLAFNNSVFTQNININLALFEKINLSASIPISTKKINVLGRNLNFPADLSLTGKYTRSGHYFSNRLSNIYFGTRVGFYSTNNLGNDNSLDKNYFQHTSVGLVAGMSFEFLRRKHLNFDISLDMNQNLYITGLPGIDSGEFSIGLVYLPEF